MFFSQFYSYHEALEWLCFGYFTLGERNDWWIDKGIWKCVNFAKTFIPKITQAQNTKITYTKMNTVYIYISQREIVLWILIMKSIIALCVAGSWCSNGRTFK